MFCKGFVDYNFFPMDIMFSLWTSSINLLCFIFFYHQRDLNAFTVIMKRQEKLTASANVTCHLGGLTNQ